MTSKYRSVKFVMARGIIPAKIAQNLSTATVPVCSGICALRKLNAIERQAHSPFRASGRRVLFKWRDTLWLSAFLLQNVSASPSGKGRYVLTKDVGWMHGNGSNAALFSLVVIE